MFIARVLRPSGCRSRNTLCALFLLLFRRRGVAVDIDERNQSYALAQLACVQEERRRNCLRTSWPIGTVGGASSVSEGGEPAKSWGSSTNLIHVAASLPGLWQELTGKLRSGSALPSGMLFVARSQEREVHVESFRHFIAVSPYVAHCFRLSQELFEEEGGGLPAVLKHSLRFLNSANGLTTPALFRLTGDGKKAQLIRSAWDQGKDPLRATTDAFAVRPNDGWCFGRDGQYAPHVPVQKVFERVDMQAQLFFCKCCRKEVERGRASSTLLSAVGSSGRAVVPAPRCGFDDVMS